MNVELQLPSLDSQWVNVLVLIVVAVATIYYAHYTRKLFQQTKRSADEMYEARLAEIEPRVKSTLGWIGPMAASLKIQNLGQGPAKNLAIEYSFKPSDDPAKKWSQQVLAPNEYVRLLLDPIEFDQLVAKYDEIDVRGSCENFTGSRKYDIVDTIRLKEVQETLKKAPQLLETSAEELLRDIQKELEELNRNVETINNALTESGIITKTKSEKASEDAELLSRLKEMREKAGRQE